MSRMEEFEILLAQCGQEVPGLEGTLDRAYAKRRKKKIRLALQSLGSFAACFALFVVLVNFSVPVASACSQIPGLRELAQAVTFSRSLSDALDNEFVQPIEQSQSSGSITAEIVALIVDQKQVNVFYRLDSPDHSMLVAEPDVRNSEGGYLHCALVNNTFDLENGELGSFTIDFLEDDVPSSLMCTLKVRSSSVSTETAPSASDRFPDSYGLTAPEALAEFRFLLELDPQFTAAAKIYSVNQVVEIDGQTFTIPEIEVYPTHLRLNVVEAEGNSAWIQDLDFYIETNTGIRFDTSSGISAHGSSRNPYVTSYRAESTYFYKAGELRLVITGAQFLDKDREKLHINLVTGESDPLPEGVSFQEAYREDDDWILSFRGGLEKGQPMYQIFTNRCYDSSGNLYEIMMWSSTYSDPYNMDQSTWFTESFPLKDYPYDEVWLSPYFTRNWIPEAPIEITIIME